MSERRYGAALSYVSMAVNMLVAFLLTPVLVEVLGKADYGLYSLVGSFVAYFLLADIGLNDTVLRYVIRYRQRGSREELGVFLGASLVGYVLVIAAVIGISIVGYGFLTPEVWPRFTAKELDDLRFLYVISVASACIVLFTNPFAAILAAYQKFIFIQFVGIATALISAVSVFAYLQYGDSVRIVFILSNVVKVSIAFFQIGYVLAVLRPPFLFRRVSAGYVREKLNFAGPILIVVLVEQIYWRIDNLLIGSILGTAAVATYAVGMLFHKYVQRMATTFSKVMSPEIIRRLEGGADAREATRLVVKTARMQMMVIMPIIAGVVFLGRDFLRLWLGEDFVGAYIVMVVTLIPYAFELSGNVRNAILQVKGLYWWRAGALLIISAINIVITLTLLPKIGIAGAAIGTGAGLVMGYLFVHWLLWRRTGFELVTFYREAWRGLWIAAATLVVTGLLVQLMSIDTWFEFILAGAALMALYAPVAWFAGMNHTERGYVLAFAKDARLLRS